MFPSVSGCSASRSSSGSCWRRTRARQEAERRLLAAAEEGGILVRSNDNVRTTVETLVRSLGFASVTVTFQGAVPMGEHR
jgi:hypothetical protein